MNNPILSICIPTYNRAECLVQCLESIVNELKDPYLRENVEVLVSDNGSADNTESVVREFQKKIPEIFYSKNSENLGYDRNVLLLLAKASGEFAWILGDDDALFSGALTYLLGEFKLGKFKYCIVNCWGYDKQLENKALGKPNMDIEQNQYYKNLAEFVRVTDKDKLVGNFGGVSAQVFSRKFWQEFADKEKFIGSQAIHLFILLSVFKDQSFALLSKPLVKVRADNIRWDTFPGLETLKKRALGTQKTLLWILNEYKIPYSKFLLKNEYYKNLLKYWLINFARKYIFKSQKTRNIIKKMLGKM